MIANIETIYIQVFQDIFSVKLKEILPDTHNGDNEFENNSKISKKNLKTFK